MILKDERVKIPDRVKILKKNNIKYVYYVAGVEHIRGRKYNFNKLVNIGKVDPENEDLLIPNENYFLFFQDNEFEIKKSDKLMSPTVSIGQYLVVKKILEELSIDKRLNDIFEAKSESIKALIFYFIDGNYGKSQLFNRWTYKNFSGFVLGLPDQEISTLFGAVITNRLMHLFNYLWGVESRLYSDISDTAYIYLNSLNFNMNSDGSASDRYATKSIYRRYPQINLSYCLDSETGLPIFYNLSPQLANNENHYKEMIQKSLDLRYKSTTLVIDNGDLLTNVEEKINSENVDFIIAPKDLNEKLAGLFEANRKNIDKNRNLISGNNVFGLKIYDEAFSNTSKKHFIYMFYDEDKAALEIEKYNTVLFRMLIDMQINEKLSTDSSRIYGDYLDFDSKDENNGTPYKVNGVNFKDALDNSGYSILVSNLDLEPREILKIYRFKDSFEESFKSLKANIDFNKPKGESSLALDGNAFLTFIATIVKSLILYKIKPFLKISTLETFDSVMEWLSKIEIVKNKKIYKFNNVLTYEQKELLDLLGIDKEFIKNIIKNINRDIS